MSALVTARIRAAGLTRAFSSSNIAVRQTKTLAEQRPAAAMVRNLYAEAKPLLVPETNESPMAK
jgi:hypothetical protein